jgi:hypothetical protein
MSSYPIQPNLKLQKLLIRQQRYLNMAIPRSDSAIKAQCKINRIMYHIDYWNAHGTFSPSWHNERFIPDPK